LHANEYRQLEKLRQAVYTDQRILADMSNWFEGQMQKNQFIFTPVYFSAPAGKVSKIEWQLKAYQYEMNALWRLNILHKRDGPVPGIIQRDMQTLFENIVSYLEKQMGKHAPEPQRLPEVRAKLHSVDEIKAFVKLYKKEMAVRILDRHERKSLEILKQEINRFMRKDKVSREEGNELLDALEVGRGRRA